MEEEGETNCMTTFLKDQREKGVMGEAVFVDNRV